MFHLFSSVQSLSHVQLFSTPWTAATRLPCPSPIPRVYPNSCPLGRWSHPTISSSVIPFSSHLQSFPALGFFQMSQFFESDGQSIRVSASASVLPMNIQDWYPLGWTGWISLQSKGLSSVFSNTTVAQLVKNLPAMQETWIWSLSLEDLWTRENLPPPVFWPGEFHGLYSPWDPLGSQRVGQDWATFTFTVHRVAKSWTGVSTAQHIHMLIVLASLVIRVVQIKTTMWYD